MVGDDGGKEGKGGQRTCIKDTWTKPMRVRLRVEIGMAEVGGSAGVKMEITVGITI